MQKTNRDGKKLLTLKTQSVRPLGHEALSEVEGGTSTWIIATAASIAYSYVLTKIR